MLIIKKEPLPFDVDNTLIKPIANKKTYKGQRVNVYDSVTNTFIEMRPLLGNIRILKEESKKGMHIIVWSKGGFQWATDVVRALGLDIYVNQIMSKPKSYVDDLPISKWLTDRIYLPANTLYKE